MVWNAPQDQVRAAALGIMGCVAGKDPPIPGLWAVPAKCQSLSLVAVVMGGAGDMEPVPWHVRDEVKTQRQRRRAEPAGFTDEARAGSCLKPHWGSRL